MRPPLMAQLMRGDEVREIDIGGFFDAADESDGFGERNGVGERLREGAVAREFENAVLAELVRAEVLLVIGQAGFRCINHVVDIVVMRGVVIDLQ